MNNKTVWTKKKLGNFFFGGALIGGFPAVGLSIIYANVRLPNLHVGHNNINNNNNNNNSHGHRSVVAYLS